MGVRPTPRIFDHPARTRAVPTSPLQGEEKSTWHERAGTRTVSVKIEGRVQGVYYRAWTKQTARSLGLDGWVLNAPDGSVEAVFSGPDGQCR